jgi:hypothetical protein
MSPKSRPPDGGAFRELCAELGCRVQLLLQLGGATSIQGELCVPAKRMTAHSSARRQLLVKACPPRAQFYDKLGSPQSKVERDLAAYLTAIESQVGMLEQFYKEGKQ